MEVIDVDSQSEVDMSYHDKPTMRGGPDGQSEAEGQILRTKHLDIGGRD
jgi:hypothetical protein